MITTFTATKHADGDPAAWLLTFSSDLTEVTFRVYRDGILVATVPGVDPGGGADLAGELLVEVPGDSSPGSSPVFDVLDDDSDPVTAAPDGYPDFVTLAWYTPDGPASAGTVAYYRIDRLIDAVWTEQARVREPGNGRSSTTGPGYFTWASGRLADATTHQFRVVPVGRNGNGGTATSFAMLVVRHPDVPAVSYAYDSGTGTVTITAA